MNRKKAYKEDVVTILLFAVVIIFLSTLSIYNCFNSTLKIAVAENRSIAPLPELTLRHKAILDFPLKYNAFFNDRFALRQELVSLINYLCYRIFSLSNSPAVVVGHHDWLFFLSDGDEDTARHNPLFSKAELKAWSDVLEARRAWLAARNCKFLFVVAPSKSSIYSEELPAACKPIVAQSRQSQLFDYLKTNSKVTVIDLRRPLVEAKPFTRIYYQTDTHWTQVGAYIAYTKIAERLNNWFPKIKPLVFDDMAVEMFKFRNGDLQNMMGLHGLLPEKVSLAYLKHPPACAICKIDNNGKPLTWESSHPEHVPYSTELSQSHLPRALCLRDSFMSAIAPLLSSNFRRVVYYWQQEFPAAEIEREKPDVVIEEIVERQLCAFEPHNPPSVDQALAREYVAAKSDRSKLASTSAAKLQ